MMKKNLLSGRDRELAEMAEQYENARANRQSIYLDAEDMADLADWYSVRQKREQALEVVEYGLKIHPENTALLTEEAYLYLDDYDTHSAREIANLLDENLPDTKILQAQILILEEREEEADRLLDTIEDKEEIDTMINVAYMYINVNKPDKAMAWLKPGLGKYEDDEPFLGVLADAYYGVGELEKATDTYNALIDKNPYSAVYWFGLARCYFDSQKYDKAIEASDYAIVSDDEFVEAYLLKGHSFFFLDNDEKGLENFREAARLGAVSQCFIDTFTGLSESGKEHWEAGLEHLLKAIDEYEDDAQISLPALYANSGICFRKLGQKRKASHYWKKAHELDPTDAGLYLLEGRMYLEEHLFDKSVRCWKQALVFAPTAQTWHEIGISFMEYGYMEQARAALEYVKKVEPDFHDINEKLATVYLMLKDKENFMRYNQLCKRPITTEDLEKVYELLKSENKEDLVEAMKRILDALQ